MRPVKWWGIVTLIVVLTLVRVASTHRVFSQTMDESWHLISGYDILTKGTFTTDLHHPPLARVLFALPFIHIPDPVADGAQARGNLLYLTNDRYIQNVARARLGNLPFLALGIIVVALWARRLISPTAGWIAAFLFASLPPILAHAGLATTDMAIAATLPLALYALTVLLEQPTWPRTIFLAIAITLGLLSKFSFLIYFPFTAAILLLLRRRFPIAKLAAALSIAFLLVWATYGFTFSTLQQADPRTVDYAQKVFGSPRLATNIPLPAPLFIAGALEVKLQDLQGTKGILFGQISPTGWWYYFPVALFYKTPIPFLLLVILGAALLLSARPDKRRPGLELLLIAAAILGISMTSHINIGVRHILPIYAPLAILAAAAVATLAPSRRLRWIPFALTAWLVVGVAFPHPDYLPWFNAFAGKEPSRILNDSNLDWGQDVMRLVRLARRERFARITTSVVGTAPLDHIGLPPRTELEAFQPVHGWVAISELNIALGRDVSPELRKWIDELLRGRGYRRVGRSIRLYYFP
jgi:dolichyl-phosphate-mannose-protein mannosyltransferase